MTTNKPLPSVVEEMVPFWQAMKRHEFVLFHCKKCGAWYFPVSYCRNHENEPLLGNMQWAQAKGRGKVFAFNIHYRAFYPSFKDDIPYVYALIELDEGPLMPSNVIGCDPAEVKIGMPVEVTFVNLNEEFTLPKFKPIKRG